MTASQKEILKAFHENFELIMVTENKVKPKFGGYVQHTACFKIRSEDADRVYADKDGFMIVTDKDK